MYIWIKLRHASDSKEIRMAVWCADLPAIIQIFYSSGYILTSATPDDKANE